MSRHSPFVIVLSDEDRVALRSIVRRQKAEQRMVLRAWIVLEAADGIDNCDIALRLGVALNTVIKWRKRFFEEGLAGLAERKRAGRPRRFSPSGGGRGQGPGVRAARHERGAAVAVELR